MNTESLVRLNVGVPHDVWRRLRDLAEERRGRGKASVQEVVRSILEAVTVGPRPPVGHA